MNTTFLGTNGQVDSMWKKQNTISYCDFNYVCQLCNITWAAQISLYLSKSHLDENNLWLIGYCAPIILLAFLFQFLCPISSLVQNVFAVVWNSLIVGISLHSLLCPFIYTIHVPPDYHKNASYNGWEKLKTITYSFVLKRTLICHELRDKSPVKEKKGKFSLRISSNNWRHIPN